MRISRGVIIKALLYLVPAAVISWYCLYVGAGPGSGSPNEKEITHALALLAWAMCYTAFMLIVAIRGYKNAALLKENLLFCGLGLLLAVLSAGYLTSYLN